MRVLVFGASTVQGYWDSHGGWAERLRKYYDGLQLASFARGDYGHEEPKVMNLGISGDGVTELLERIESETKARQNDKGVSIVISIGTNSSAIINGSEIATVEQFQKNLRQVIDIAKKYTDKVMLVGLPAVDETKTNPIAWADMSFQNQRIHDFEAVAKHLAEQLGMPFVPVHGEFQRRAEDGEKLSAHDGLHPNDKGHKLIFELVRPALDDLLNN